MTITFLNSKNQFFSLYDYHVQVLNFSDDDTGFEIDAPISWLIRLFQGVEHDHVFYSCFFESQSKARDSNRKNVFHFYEHLQLYCTV